MKPYLTTTGMSEIWDLDSNLLLLGPWCFTSEKNKKLLEGKSYTLVPSPWKPTTKIKEAADYCNSIYENLLLQLTDILNSIHQSTYPVRYWRILIGPWLLHFIGVFYERYMRIKNVLEMFPDFYMHVLPKERCNLTSIDTFDFLAGATAKVNDDYYNLKLFSLIAHELCPQKIIEIKKELKFGSKIKHTNTCEYGWKFKIFYRLLRRIDSFLKCPLILTDMYHLGFYDFLRLKLKTGFNKISFIIFEYSEEETSLENNYSSELRQKVKLKNAPDVFQSLLYRIIHEAMPMIYMENYKFYKDDIVNSGRIKIIGSAVGWYFNERFKFFAAEAVAKGAYSIDFQHGSSYGNLLALPSENISCEKDKFYVWGWESQHHENKKLKNLPSPRLSKIKDTYFCTKEQILFISTGQVRYYYRFFTVPQSEEFASYLSDQIKLFDSIPDKIRKNVIYRPYAYHNFGWGEKERLLKKYPAINLLDKGGIIEYMQTIKLTIIDHPGTSFIEALAINVPSILYWDDNVWLMRPEAEKYFEKLRNAGILHKTPVGAAKKIIDIFDQPLTWWQSKEVQDARNAFLAQYGYSRKDWIDVWAKEICSLVSSVRKN